MSRMAPNWVTLAVNGTNLGPFLMSFSMALRVRMYRNVIFPWRTIAVDAFALVVTSYTALGGLLTDHLQHRCSYIHKNL